MRFGYTIIYVRDVAAAVEFYERAFGVQRRYVADEGTYAELETGETVLAFAANELAESHLPGGFRRNDPSEPPAGIEIAFSTGDVAAAFERAVAAGAAPVAEPHEKPWGQTISYVRDLEGVLVEIASEL